MRLGQIEARLAEIALEMTREDITGDELSKLRTEAEKLTAEKRQIEKEIEDRNKKIADVAGGAGMPIGNVNIPVQPV